MCMQNINLLVFSPSQRQSHEFADLVKQALVQICGKGMDKGFSCTVSEDNKERLVLFTYNGFKNRILILPCNSKTVRGFSPHIVILEEAAVMPPLFIGEVVMPMMTVKNTCMICISTIQNKSNYYSVLPTIRYSDGNTVFDVKEFFSVCDKCREEKKVDSCQHMIGNVPSWIADDRNRSIKAVYDALGMYLIFNRLIN